MDLMIPDSARRTRDAEIEHRQAHQSHQ